MGRLSFFAKFIRRATAVANTATEGDNILFGARRGRSCLSAGRASECNGDPLQPIDMRTDDGDRCHYRDCLKQAGNSPDQPPERE